MLAIVYHWYLLVIGNSSFECHMRLQNFFRGFSVCNVRDNYIYVVVLNVDDMKLIFLQYSSPTSIILV